MTLDELLEAVRSDEPGALDKLLVHLSSRLHGYLARRFGDDRAPDLTQDTLVVIAKKLPNFEGRGDDLVRWAFGIARLEGHEAARQQARYDTMLRKYAQVGPASVTNLSSRLDFVERLELVEGAVEKLSAKNRRAIANELVGGDASSLASQENITTSSARARKTRAYQRLRIIVSGRSQGRRPRRWTVGRTPPRPASSSSASSSL